MCRLACNVCGVTTVNGSSVGSSSCGRLSTRCSLSVISPDRPSTAGVLHSFGYCTCSVWTTISLSVYLSVLAASASLQHLTTSSFCPEAPLCFYCYTGSHRLASMGVRSAATCLGEHTISPTFSSALVLTFIAHRVRYSLSSPTFHRSFMFTLSRFAQRKKI